MLEYFLLLSVTGFYRYCIIERKNDQGNIKIQGGGEVQVDFININLDCQWVYFINNSGFWLQEQYLEECYRSAWFGVEHTEYPDAFFVILFNMYVFWAQLKGNVDICCIGLVLFFKRVNEQNRYFLLFCGGIAGLHLQSPCHFA